MLPPEEQSLSGLGPVSQPVAAPPTLVIGPHEHFVEGRYKSLGEADRSGVAAEHFCPTGNARRSARQQSTFG